MRHRPLTFLTVALGLACAASCVSQQTDLGVLEVPIQVLESSHRYSKQYLLAPGDSVEVVVLNNPTVSRTVTVRPDGFISLPIVDDVRAQGLSVPELDDKLTGLFDPRLVDPEVSVIATSTRPAMIYVHGEVAAPQGIELRSARTAAQAVALAGGFTNDAALQYVTIIRLTPDGHLRAITPTLAAEEQPDPYMLLQMVHLEADDIVLVPESDIAQFNRWIDVYLNRPLSGVNTVMGTYLNFRLIEFYDAAIDG